MALETKIEELPEKYDIEDSNIFIVEDEEDTKKATIEMLKKAFSGDDVTASRYKFYSSQYMETIIATLRSAINSCANTSDLEALSKRVAQIVAGTGEGKDSELIDARDGETTLHERIKRDYNILNDIKPIIISRQAQEPRITGFLLFKMKFFTLLHNGIRGFFLANVSDKVSFLFTIVLHFVPQFEQNFSFPFSLLPQLGQNITIPPFIFI